VFTYACNVTDYAAVCAAIEAANAFHARITDHVICNAGICYPGLVVDTTVDQFRETMETNFFGTLNLVKATLPAMIASPLPANDPIKRRRVVLVSAEGGLATVAGYSNYSSSKYAVRGFAEAMRSELQLYGIDVSIYYPGDMDSPLLADEQEFKPAVTKELVVPSNPASPDEAARALIHGISRGYFAFSNELILQVLRALSNGVAPRANTPLEFVVAPLGVLLQTAYLWYFDRIVEKHGRLLQHEQQP
jgi:3-dehydrosphinganine reductase